MQSIRYTAWFDPRFPISAAKAEHAAVDWRLLDEIRLLREDIEENGLRNPLVVVCKHGVWNVHPGKCRHAAISQLGWDEFPALVVNYDLPGYQSQAIPEHCRALATEGDFRRLFDEDMYVKVTHRFVTVHRKYRKNLDKPYVD